MTHPWSELQAKMPKEALERSHREALQLIAEIREQRRREAMLAVKPDMTTPAYAAAV